MCNVELVSLVKFSVLERDDIRADGAKWRCDKSFSIRCAIVDWRIGLIFLSSNMLAAHTHSGCSRRKWDAARISRISWPKHTQSVYVIDNGVIFHVNYVRFGPVVNDSKRERVLELETLEMCVVVDAGSKRSNSHFVAPAIERERVMEWTRVNSFLARRPPRNKTCD